MKRLKDEAGWEDEQTNRETFATENPTVLKWLFLCPSPKTKYKFIAWSLQLLVVVLFYCCMQLSCSLGCRSHKSGPMNIILLQRKHKHLICVTLHRPMSVISWRFDLANCSKLGGLQLGKLFQIFWFSQLRRFPCGDDGGRSCFQH